MRGTGDRGLVDACRGSEKPRDEIKIGGLARGGDDHAASAGASGSESSKVGFERPDFPFARDFDQVVEAEKEI